MPIRTHWSTLAKSCPYFEQLLEHSARLSDRLFALETVSQVTPEAARPEIQYLVPAGATGQSTTGRVGHKESPDRS